SRRDAIQIEQRPLRRAERDLRHLVRLKLHVIADNDLLHASPPAIERHRSSTGCRTSIAEPLARNPFAIWSRQPGLPDVTMRAPVATMRATFCSSSRSAMSGWNRL